MALKNLMGLVCDPVAGLVEVPCVKRNVVGSVNAVSCADMALAGVESRIPVDEVIDCMGEVGRRMPMGDAGDRFGRSGCHAYRQGRQGTDGAAGLTRIESKKRWEQYVPNAFFDSCDFICQVCGR